MLFPYKSGRGARRRREGYRLDFASSRFDPAAPADFAVLMVLVSARQGASVSARRQARIGQPERPAAGLLSPPDGAFSAAVAETLRPRMDE